MIRKLSRLEALFTSRNIPISIAILITLLGVSVLLGWHVHYTPVIRIVPTLPPMQYNTALCFCMLGLGLALVLLRQRHASAFCSIGVITFAGATLSQYITGADLGLDSLWMDPFITSGTVHPGRMAPATAIGHVIAATILLCASQNRAGMLRLGLLLASGLTSTGVSIAFGYIVQLPTTFWWGQANTMAFHTAVAFAILGLGLFIHVWRQAARLKLLMFPWALAAFGLALILATFGLWQALTMLRQSDLQRVVHQEARAAHDAMLADLKARRGVIERMARRWTLRGGTPEQEWKQDALNHIRDMEGFRALKVLTSDFKVSWVAGADQYGNLVGQPYLTDRYRRQALEAALARKAAFTSDLVELREGGTGFLTIAPTYQQGQPTGAIVAVYRLDEWLNSILSHEDFQNYNIAVFHNNRLKYRRVQDGGEEGNSLVERNLKVDGLQIHLHVWPSRKLEVSTGKPLPEVVLGAGVLMSTLLTATLFLLRSVRWQGVALATANESLQNQNEKLRRTEQTLQTTTQLQQAVLADISPLVFVGLPGEPSFHH